MKTYRNINYLIKQTGNTYTAFIYFPGRLGTVSAERFSNKDQASEYIIKEINEFKKN